MAVAAAADGGAIRKRCLVAAMRTDTRSDEHELIYNSRP